MVADAVSECSIGSGLRTCRGDVGTKDGAAGDIAGPGLLLKASSISFLSLHDTLPNVYVQRFVVDRLLRIRTWVS